MKTRILASLFAIVSIALLSGCMHVVSEPAGMKVVGPGSVDELVEPENVALHTVDTKVPAVKSGIFGRMEFAYLDTVEVSNQSSGIVHPEGTDFMLRPMGHRKMSLNHLGGSGVIYVTFYRYPAGSKDPDRSFMAEFRLGNGRTFARYNLIITDEMFERGRVVRPRRTTFNPGR